MEGGSKWDLKGPPLPLSCLRLLVPPLRLVSAAIWQTVRQKVVADYGMLEEFVSMVTEIAPELLTRRQRAELILGLRARLILELCRSEAAADLQILQPHLDRMQILSALWGIEHDAVDMELSNSNFIGLVQTLLKSLQEREHFFQNVFPEEFGPTYDKALETLMWQFLSRLEKLLPLQTLQQVASLLGDAPSVLEECMESVSHPEELKTLLEYQKDLSHLEHNDCSIDGACIISALNLSPVERRATVHEKTQSEVHTVSDIFSIKSGMAKESARPENGKEMEIETIVDVKNGEIQVEEPHIIMFSAAGSSMPLDGETNSNEESLGILQTQEEDKFRLKQTDYRVLLKELDVPTPLNSRPVRRNRGLKMKAILLQEKNKKRKTRPYEEERHARKPKSASQAAANESRAQAQTSPPSSKYMCPSVTEDKVTCSEAAPTGGGLPEGSDDKDSISIGSDEDPSYVGPVGSCEEASSFSSDEDPSIMASIDDEDFSVISKVQDASHAKATATKKTRSITHRGLCCICKEHVKVNMADHMKVHFPNDDYACPHCNTKFTSWSCMKSHLAKTCYVQQQVGPEEAGTQSVFKCDKWYQAFRYKLSQNEHKRTHNQLYCEVCRKVLRDSETLARHKVSHTPFQCTLCEVSFRHFKPLAKHYEVTHQLRSPFNCNHCPKRFSEFRLFIRHEWRHTGQLPFQCSQCSKRFKSDSDLVVHLGIHTGEKVFLCWKCGKAMRYRVSLKRHIKICKHKQIQKPHTCSQCQLSFKLKDSLRNHERIKHKVTTNASVNYRRCFICKEQVSGQIKDHMKIHFPKDFYTCSRCNSTFALLGSLKLHLKRTCFDQQQVGPEEAEGAQSFFRCDECDQAFRYELSLKEHNKCTHNQLYCEVCRKVVRDSETLARHKSSHTAFQCTLCEENFRHYKHLAKHYENVHKLSKPFSCKHCPKNFTKLKFFIRHEWKHTGYLPFQCSRCSMRFKDDPDLVSHLRVHTREKPFLCEECGKAFSCKSNLSRHLKSIHSRSPNEKKYSCPQCEKSYKEKGALDTHKRRKHLNELFRSQCPDCGKLLSRSTMDRHRLIHTGLKPFKCKMAECDKSFRTVTEMKKHMQYHKEERPFQCSVCGKGFVMSCLLNQHMRIHTGEKPHVCSLCGKAFLQLYSMKRHKKLMHTFEVK